MSSLKSLMIMLVLFLFALSCLRLNFQGEGELYSEPNSSSIRVNVSENQTGIEKIKSILSVKAENVFVPSKCDLKEILFKYNARIVITERIGEITNYYCRAYSLGSGVYVNGRLINLHIAVADYGYTLGSPIICGSF